MTLTWSDQPAPPTANAERFGGRWRLIGAGLSNVWRYGDLDLPATSGRLLLRGPNGTGKTTALEVLWPYLLDLNSARLGAGKARNTHLSNLMREGADGRRRTGYVWLSFAAPADGASDSEGVVSYGVRLAFSEGGSPPVRVTPFAAPGRPLHELALWGPGRATLSAEQFSELVTGAGGTIFDSPDDYIRDLASRIFVTDAADLTLLAERIRQVRNPALLGELSPRDAADALRASLPGVSAETIEATGEALAESDATRIAFESDRDAADALEDFARIWTGHTVDVTRTVHGRAVDAAAGAADAQRKVNRIEGELSKAGTAAETAQTTHTDLVADEADRRERLSVLEKSEDYRAAGRLRELDREARSLADTADANWQTLAGQARTSSELVERDINNLTDLAEDLDGIVDQVAAHEPDVAGTKLLRWSRENRPPYRVGDREVAAGAALVAEADDESLTTVIDTARARATQLRQDADRARTFVGAHRTVATAEAEAAKARAEAGRLATTAEEQAALAKGRATTAATETDALAELARAWVLEAVEAPIGADDLAEIDWTEPAAALAGVDVLAAAATTWAHEGIAKAEADARDRDEQSAELRAEAAGLREEAAAIRADGTLLPLPRPDWAGAGDDRDAFGSAIDWRHDVDATIQDIAEATLAAAGLLGATLTADGIDGSDWRVLASGAEAPANLGQLLRSTGDHRHADAAAAVLNRIALAPTATDSDHPVVIGLDGTFRTGVLYAKVPAAQATELRQPASHIGGPRRRAAALAHADRLDIQARELDAQADTLERQAEAARSDARHLRDVLSRFPDREPLRSAEAARAAAAAASHDAEVKAGNAERHADGLAETARGERHSWTTTVIDAGLPADVDALAELVRNAANTATALESSAAALDGKYRQRITKLIGTVNQRAAATALDELHARATTSHNNATDARSRYEELHAQQGRTAQQALDRHRELSDEIDKLGPKVKEADSEARKLAEKAAGLGGQLVEANEQLQAAAPIAAQELAKLAQLLEVPGVAEAIFGPDTAVDADGLLDQLAASLDGRPTSSKRALRERADETKARFAGVWAIDPGVDHPELDTYLLTHGSTSFTPIAAAGHARLLATRAEEALRAADEAALQDFVIGRLPAAVAQAWTRLHDWVNEVNTKMRAAAASSGVGVAVRVSVRDELPPLVRAVYDLVCKSGDALRDPAAKAEAGRAIHQLINAADGDDMTSRVAAAVDVRDWVDVVYQVTRPGENPRTWGSRTGLSGGERRLVVLAPMLAAVAAAYDTLPDTAARLAALDEVPSEVDETGREGLARYIASLDLDLIATSHHWDGAPGAWDGIDAHDLEAAPDGTVVAFPMLVRGLDPLPGDTHDGHDLSPV